jgi:large subunit ribosomal protein L1
VNIDQKLVNKALLEALDHSVYKKEGKPDKTRKFDETIDLIINVREIDIKNPNNRIEQEFMLPHPLKGNKKKVCFIARDDMEMELKKNGYPVINPERLEELNKKGNKDKKQIVKQYDYFVARSDLMRDLAKVLARFLGQQGKMPKPQPKGFSVISPNENLKEYIPKLERIISIDMKKQLPYSLKWRKSPNPLKILWRIFRRY